MSFIVGTNDKGALITEKSVLMIKLLKKTHPKTPEQSTPPIQFFHSLFYNYLKLTQIMSWGLQQAEHLGCFSSTDGFVVALLEEKERGKNLLV